MNQHELNPVFIKRALSTMLLTNPVGDMLVNGLEKLF